MALTLRHRIACCQSCGQRLRFDSARSSVQKIAAARDHMLFIVDYFVVPDCRATVPLLGMALPSATQYNSNDKCFHVRARKFTFDCAWMKWFARVHTHTDLYSHILLLPWQPVAINIPMHIGIISYANISIWNYGVEFQISFTLDYILFPNITLSLIILIIFFFKCYL